MARARPHNDLMNTWTGRATLTMYHSEQRRRRATTEEAQERAVSWRHAWTGLLGIHWVVFLLWTLAGFDARVSSALFGSAYVHAMVFMLTYGWFEAWLSRRLPVVGAQLFRVYNVVPAVLSLNDDATLDVRWRWHEAIEVDREPLSRAPHKTHHRPDRDRAWMRFDLDSAVLHLARDNDTCVLIELQDPTHRRHLVIGTDGYDHLATDTLDGLPVIEREPLQLDAPASFLDALSDVIGAVRGISRPTRHVLEALAES